MQAAEREGGRLVGSVLAGAMPMLNCHRNIF